MEEDGKEEDFIIGIDKEEGGKITSHREQGQGIGNR